MALAAHAAKVFVTTSVTDTSSSADELDGCNSVQFERVRAELETTDFKDTSGAKTFILGLQECQVSGSCDYESADTAQGRLNTAFGDGSSVWIHVKWDASAGHKVECKVPSLRISADVGDKVKLEFTLRPTGAVAASA